MLAALGASLGHTMAPGMTEDERLSPGKIASEHVSRSQPVVVQGGLQSRDSVLLYRYTGSEISF